MSSLLWLTSEGLSTAEPDGAVVDHAGVARQKWVGKCVAFWLATPATASLSVGVFISSWPDKARLRCRN